MYLEDVLGAAYPWDPDEHTRYSVILERLRSAALPEEEARDFIAKVSKEHTWAISERGNHDPGLLHRHLAQVQPQAVGVRDSKDPDGPILVFEQRTFATFLHSLQLDSPAS